MCYNISTKRMEVKTMANNKLNVIVIGAGNRGNRYAGLMAEYPEHYELVGMADPEEARRKHFHHDGNARDHARYQTSSNFSVESNAN